MQVLASERGKSGGSEDQGHQEGSGESWHWKNSQMCSV